MINKKSSIFFLLDFFLHYYNQKMQCNKKHSALQALDVYCNMQKGGYFLIIPLKQMKFLITIQFPPIKTVNSPGSATNRRDHSRKTVFIQSKSYNLRFSRLQINSLKTFNSDRSCHLRYIIRR